MNKYLDLAEQVLTKTDGMMSARQIWDIGEGLSMTKGTNFGKTPWVTLGRMLASEVKQSQQSSVFGTVPGSPVYYFCKSAERRWKDLEWQADVLVDIYKDNSAFLLKL